MVRVRFAPSPTGLLHLGNARTALLTWLFARSHGGSFLLRIDDTDTQRSRQEYVEALVQDLSWLGLTWDATFRQQDRRHIYETALAHLKAIGRVYPCFETPAELQEKRQAQLAQGLPPVYDRTQRAKLCGIPAPISPSDVDTQQPCHWRFWLDHQEESWQDLIQGEVTYHTRHLSDPIVVREDGSISYLLSSVIDDYDAGITHILRGADHLTNTAIQRQMFRALGQGCNNQSIKAHASQRLWGQGVQEIFHVFQTHHTLDAECLSDTTTNVMTGQDRRSEREEDSNQNPRTCENNNNKHTLTADPRTHCPLSPDGQGRLGAEASILANTIAMGSERAKTPDTLMESRPAFDRHTPVDTTPTFAHFPLMMDATGHKFSKRMGSLTIQALRQEGILPASIISALASFGTAGSHTGDGTTWISRFRLADYSNSSAHFDAALIDQHQIHLVSHLSFDQACAWAQTCHQPAPCTPDLWQVIAGNVTRPQEIAHWNAVVKPGLLCVQQDVDLTFLDSIKIGDVLATALHAWQKTQENQDIIDHTTWDLWVQHIMQATDRRWPKRTVCMTLRWALTARIHGPRMQDLCAILTPEIIIQRLQC